LWIIFSMGIALMVYVAYQLFPLFG
jgi:hypothetical protein